MVKHNFASTLVEHQRNSQRYHKALREAQRKNRNNNLLTISIL